MAAKIDKLPHTRFRMRSPRSSGATVGKALLVMHIHGKGLGTKTSGTYTLKNAPTLAGDPTPLMAKRIVVKDQTIVKVAIYLQGHGAPASAYKPPAPTDIRDPTDDTLTVTVDNPDDNSTDQVDVPVDLVDADPCDDTSSS
jgi:hypothetical protein